MEHWLTIKSPEGTHCGVPHWRRLPSLRPCAETRVIAVAKRPKRGDTPGFPDSAQDNTKLQCCNLQICKFN